MRTLLAALTCLMLFATPLVTSTARADEFFGNELSPRERHSIASSQENLETSMEGFSDLLWLLKMQNFAEGKCQEFFELESAAKNGDGKSQFILSDLYRNGYCVLNDDTRALQWAQKAAENGYEPAYLDVGVFLYEGIGTKKNPAAAVPWLVKATATRIEAHRLLGMIYRDGKGVTQSYQKSYEHLLRGAQLGDPTAQALLVVTEVTGGFKFSDLFNAYKWSLIANASGKPNIVDALSDITTKLEESLSRDKVIRAQAEASEWTAQKLEPTATTHLSAIELPTIEFVTILMLSQQQANTRLVELGLEKDRFLFFKAIAEDNLAVTALYIRAGASPETTSVVLFDTPLLHAARNGSFRVAQYLLSAGADIDRTVNSDKDTPVLLSLSRGHRELAEFLISRGAKLDHPGIMYSAVEFNDPAFLEMLQSKGVPIDLEYVGTPLGNALSAVDFNLENLEHRCHEKSAAFLIANGARLDGLNRLGQTIWQRVLQTVNPVECVKLLLQNGMNQLAVHGQEPLFIAVMDGNTELVRILLEHDGNPNLRFVLESDHVPMVLVGDGKNTVMNGGSLLQLAVVEQHAGIARLLIQYGAKWDSADNLGRTPMSVAVGNGDTLMIAVLKGEM